MKKKKRKLIIGGGCALAIVVIAGVIILPKVLNPNAGKVTTVAKASLEKVLETSNLQTLDYSYNAIADVKDEDGKNVKYHVAYEGTVTAGIDMDNVDVSVKEDEKKIVISVPEATVQNVDVDMGKMEFIFEKQKYETETVSQEAYQACLEDLDSKAKKDDSLLTMARENAVNSITALISPWIEQMKDKYTVEVK